ncbi:PP2C family serine/threonine-protein phosphatase [Quadrisphaera sp. DSM 44207]|uniref:PP2C family protein-serine/threonine phosphatase n=1 Tax=Quadrisphaera sp. DSM 44207 TaxID=1881057 RepID=UPI0008831C4D|nr:PP2C family serine/threonine-protein phosphatase [Quadrisphaera sp. DSM 44207]SDQ22690.1 protein phosphatase [Quadrisphaera sp. DSM 44207]
MTVHLRAAARSDVGLVRSDNQDSAYAGVRLLVVADGMGGHAGGDVASSVAVGELAALDGAGTGRDGAAAAAGGEDPRRAAEELEAAVARAQQALLRRVAQDPSLGGMGTTVTALLRAGEELVLAHVGDSRGYLLHDGVLTRVTTDHTFVQRLVEEGRITPEEAERHPQRNVILRVLGDVESAAEPDVSVHAALPGDRWLLCSDGLSGVVSDETIAETLASVADRAACAERLVQLALRAGGPDNITCVVADVVDGAGGDAGGRPGASGAAGAGVAAVQVVGAAAADRARPSAAASSPAARAAVLSRSAAPLRQEARGEAGRADAAPAGAPLRAGGAVGTLPSPAEGDERAWDWDRQELARRAGAAGAASEDDAAAGRPGASPAGRRRRRVGPLLALGAVLLLLGGGVLAGWSWLGRQYYVGVEDERVAVFRGLSQDVGPVPLSSVVEQEDLAVADLPPVYRERVEGTIPADDLAHAQRIVEELRDQARAPGDAAS